MPLISGWNRPVILIPNLDLTVSDDSLTLGDHAIQARQETYFGSLPDGAELYLLLTLFQAYSEVAE